MVGVYPSDEGTALATVRRSGDLAPTLELCTWQAAGPAKNSGNSLSRLVNSTHADRCRCIGLVGLGDYTLVLVEAPDVEPEEMRAAIRWRIRDLVDFNIDEAVWMSSMCPRANQSIKPTWSMLLLRPCRLLKTGRCPG